MTNSITLFRARIHIINFYVIILLGFFIPISPTMGSVLSLLVFLLWLIEGNLKNKAIKIIENRAILAFILLFSLYVIGLFYTTDLKNGFYLIKKALYLLLTPVIYTVLMTEREKGLAIKSFIAGVLCSVFISYLIYFRILKFNDISPSCPTIIHYGYYSIHLSFAIFYLLNSFFKNHSKTIILIIILMSINLFMQYGRIGQIAFLVLIIFVGMKRYGMKGILWSMLIVCILSICVYNISPVFKVRFNAIVEGIVQFHTKEEKNAVGIRLIFWQNTLKIIKANPIFGVGTGDFNLKYAEIKGTMDKESDNPHNNYLLILVLFGLPGFIIFLNLFYQLIRYSFSSPNREIIQILVITMLLLMLSESPLMRYGMLYFTYLSGLVLKKWS